MKRSLLILCAALLVVAAPTTSVRADEPVPIDIFYDALSPYGDWIYTSNYGYVWQPLVAQQSDWAPYSDGSWAYTDAGWTWISNEDFGWATYHYGRWIRLQQSWVWVPGTEWAPAWVSWRQTQSQIGWAPLPPEAAWAPNTGFGAWTDSYYDVGPAYYNFVPVASFASTASLLPYILNRGRNYSFYDQSVNITNIAYRQNVLNHIFVGGPDPARIDQFGGHPVRRLTLRRDDDRFRQNWDGRPGERPRGAGGPAHIENNQLVIASPSIRREASHGLPPRVREHMDQPQIDRGWQGDPQNVERMHQAQREDLTRNRPQNLPDKSHGPATSVMPPPAIGRVLNPEERNGGRPGGIAQRPDSRRREEEIRRGPPGTTANPAPGIPERTPQNPTAPVAAPPNTVPANGNGPRPQPGLVPRGPTGQRPGDGMQPNGNNNPRPDGAVPNGAANPTQQAPATPPQAVPQQPRQRPEFPGNRERPQGRPPEARSQPVQPMNPPPAPQQPRVNPAPMPQPHVQPQQPVRPMPQPGGNNAPHVAPQPHFTPPAAGHGPGPQGQGGPGGHRR